MKAPIDYAPPWLCVRASERERCRAIELLTRPGEVAHLVNPYRALARAYSADDVAVWLHRQLTAGGLRYFADPPACDRWSAPRLTLSVGGGDCDDLSILVLSVLRAAGIQSHAVVGFLRGTLGDVGHMWVEGTDVFGWFLIESTNGAILRRAPWGYVSQLRAAPGWCRVEVTRNNCWEYCR
ncbi:MAG: transglutaminase domain-containing protein [Planctomycetes bacterium]|nr:transglutaminase domain-containing protein [Planctomycetota bacterium]